MYAPNAIQAQGGYGPQGMGGGGGGSEPPKKYIKIDGVMQLNPAYKAYQASQGKQATTALNPDKALPVATNMDDHEQMRQASIAAGGGDVALSAATDATIQMMQEPDICKQVGVSPDAMVDGLGRLFAKHEAPMGLMNKLMALSEYDELEFMIDDSGSMSANSDTKNSRGQWQTRWEEAQGRMKEMLEIMAYVPTPKISICFLNRRDRIQLQRQGEAPEVFIQNAYRQLDNVFARPPMGTTPVLEKLTESLNAGRGRRVSRYLFCDGQPNGGVSAQDAITDLVKTRQDPQGNPLTFLSCTDQDHEVEWMKEAEEIAPFCAEYDDFEDEAREVARDQGDALPFTKGFHLIGQLVGAMNPDDLDAMDESVPLTKWTLDNLLGVQTNEQEYRRYWEGFKEAQRRRQCVDNMDRIKAQHNWEPHFHAFLTQHVAKQIPAVQQFKVSIGENPQGGGAPQAQPQPQPQPYTPQGGPGQNWGSYPPPQGGGWGGGGWGGGHR